MALTLHVEADRWRAHQRAVCETYPGIVPVTKGNGYGFGNARLAAEAAKLGADTLAVGTYDELPQVTVDFAGDILVMTPWRPFVPGETDPRLVHTVSRLDDLAALAERVDRPRVVVEVLTSMRRHGLQLSDLGPAAALLDRLRCEGWALHLPLPTTGSHRAEVETWIGRLRTAGLPVERLYVSHLTDVEVAGLASAYPDIAFRPRIGTALWLGDRSSYHAHAHVLDVHPLRRGDRFGYRQRRAPGNGHLVVVAGGTAHGIALEAPSHVENWRTRAKVLAAGGLEATGRALSPFSIAGRRRWFAEPPHMQVSLLFVPGSVVPPQVGDELDVNVGMTLTTFDQVLFS